VAHDDLILDIGRRQRPAGRQAQSGRNDRLERSGRRIRIRRLRARHRNTGARHRRQQRFQHCRWRDTLAAIAKYGIERNIGYISTGGGAFLEVLEGKTLPALQILAQRART